MPEDTKAPATPTPADEEKLTPEIEAPSPQLEPPPPKQEVGGQVVILDYAELTNVRFFQCKLVYRGGRPPIINNVIFDHCEFIFEGPALSTAQFLHTMAISEGGKALVLSILGIK
jgi:hypothetical protein